jgi:hypothetical protein
VRQALLALLLLTASPLQAATVTLAWDPPPDPVITGYRLQYGVAPGTGTWQMDVLSGVHQVTLTLAPGTYTFIAHTLAGPWVSTPTAPLTLTLTGEDPSCTPPLGSNSIAIFPTRLTKTGSGGAGSRARLDFQVSSLNSPVTRVELRGGSLTLSVMSGTDLGPLAGMWFTTPSVTGVYNISVFAQNLFGCTRLVPSGFGVAVP